MKLTGALTLAVIGLPLFAAYSYYYTDTLTTVNTGTWTQNGSVTPTTAGLTSSSSAGGSLISSVAVPDGTSQYEVRSTLTLVATGGTYVQYVRATADAKSGSSPTGTYYSVELQNPTFGGSCSATLAAYKRVGGVVSLLTSTTVACHTGMTIRSTVLSTGLRVFLDDAYQFDVALDSIPTGQPGVGVIATPAGNTLAKVELGPLDRLPPSAPSLSSVGTAAFPNRVDLQWQGVADDSNGVGIWDYSLYRDGVLVSSFLTPEVSDAAVSPSTTYTYWLQARDYHSNSSTLTSFTITTPPLDSIDSLRVGVHPLGAYWGDAGELIDTRSGNLNFSLPLVRASGRGTWVVPFSLNYNSQLWRQDPGGTWKLGRDVGYGFGWQLMAGSITPYWSDRYTVHHYLCTDSRGTEFRLDVNTNGVWTSREGTYASYVENTHRLYFPNGTYWVMDAVSAGKEQDAGTRYPTLMQDRNGNQILIRYNTGAGAPWASSSARISQIEDVRAPVSSHASYEFTYNTDSVPHLTSIGNYLSSGEHYSFAYAQNQSLTAPFSPPASFGTTTFLQSVTQTGLPVTHQFEYATGAGELTKVTFPYAGTLRWEYIANTYLGTRQQREVQNRYLRKSAQDTETGHTFSWSAGQDASRPVHLFTQLNEIGGLNQKYWSYTWQAGASWSGTTFEFIEGSSSNWQHPARRDEYAYSQDAAGTPYLSSTTTTLDGGTAYQQQSKTERALDSHGNVSWAKQYDYGNLVTPARTYTNTYVTTSNYTSRYMFDRLATTTLSATGLNVTLVQNTYDTYGVQPCLFATTALADRTGLREHDSANYSALFYYRGNITTQVTPDSQNCFTHDITGMVTVHRDALGHGEAVSPAATTNNAAPGLLTPNDTGPLSATLAYTTSLAVTSVSGPNGATATTRYDAYARPQQSTSPHGAVTAYTYTTSPPTQKAITNGHWVTVTFDGLGRTVKLEKGDAAGTKSVTDTEYAPCACSPLGKVKRVSQPYAPGGTVYWTTYTYDERGRTLTEIAPDGSTTAYVYQGNTVKVTDPTGKWKLFTRNVFGNLTKGDRTGSGRWGQPRYHLLL